MGLPMGPYGAQWVPMSLPVCSYGALWVPVGPYESLWNSLWVTVGPYGSLYGAQWVPAGLPVGRSGSLWGSPHLGAVDVGPHAAVGREVQDVAVGQWGPRGGKRGGDPLQHRPRQRPPTAALRLPEPGNGLKGGVTSDSMTSDPRAPPRPHNPSDPC